MDYYWMSTYQGSNKIKVGGKYFDWMNNASPPYYKEYTNPVGDDYNYEDSDFQDMSSTLSLADTDPTRETGTSEWGAETISKADFVDPSTGQPRSIEDIKTRLAPRLPGLTSEELENQITTMAPKYSEDVYGMAKEKEFAKEAYSEDIYGLQAGARKIGGAMRQTYGGMGGGMRAGIGATGALGTQFAQAGQQYKQSMYDIEQEGISKYERDIEGWLDPTWFDTTAKEGGYVKRDRSGITNNSEETFLDVLSQLPDAGGS